MHFGRNLHLRQSFERRKVVTPLDKFERTLHSTFALHFLLLISRIMGRIKDVLLFLHTRSSPIKTRGIRIPRVHWLTAVPQRPAPICQPLRRYSAVRLLMPGAETLLS